MQCTQLYCGFYDLLIVDIYDVKTSGFFLPHLGNVVGGDFFYLGVPQIKVYLIMVVCSCIWR